MRSDTIVAHQRRRRLTAAVGALIALAWAPLGLLHLDGAQMLAGDTGSWLAVHWMQTALLPLLGLVMWHALDLPGRAAAIGRAATLVWAAALGAFGGIAAIANGLLVEAGFTDAARHLWTVSRTGAVLPVGVVAHLAWVVAAVAGALALRQHGAPRTTQIAMALAALLMATGHGDVISSSGAVALAVAVYLAIAGRVVEPPAGGDGGAARVRFEPTSLPRRPSPRALAHRLVGADGARRRRGLLAVAGGLLGCGVTTVLVGAGIVTAGGGLLGGPELPLVVVTGPLAVATGALVRRRRRARHPLGG